VRLPITALATALLVSIPPAVASAQTGNGVLDVWLKARGSANAANDRKVTLYTKSKALVIGIDAYDGRNWPQLSNGIRDAEEVAKGLAAQGFEVRLRKNLKSSDLEDALKFFFHHEGVDPDTRLLLWFAGHGYTLNGEGYIIPADTPSPKAIADFRDKAISLRRFGEYMREANAKHVLAIFDSCFSGTVFNVARSLPPPAITAATTQPVREFISSGESEQQVSDDGTFRKLFLDVLAGKEPDADANHDGYVTGTELGLFLHQKMSNLTNNRQTPRYGKLNAYGYDRGDFVFQVGRPEVAAPPVPTQPISEVAQVWEAIKDGGNSGLLEIFLRRYGDGPYGDLARARLEELRHTEKPPAQPVEADVKAIVSRDEWPVSQARTLLAQGKISAARILLSLAAEARNPRAAFVLGTTYDPIFLEKMGIPSASADVDLARAWYEQAKAYGSQEAQYRLESMSVPPVPRPEQ
jgi:hypothetical protein